ncbi:MAG: SDR family oxidoreductase [Acidimicrobiia bacterium]|nr:SDR family oxidoreductase [Acidimicrobiia bacterium]
MADLSGRRVLVTGASSGIGRAVAVALAEAGAVVALLARRGQELDALVGELRAVGARAVATPADVTDVDEVQAAVALAADELDGLDGVVAAAGVVRPGGLAEVTPEDWRLTFDVNVVGFLNTCHAALGPLRAAESADVVAISSMSGRRRASVAMGIYSASKHAVHVLCDSLRDELGPDGVRVTIVSPGYVRTPIFDEVADDELRARYQDALAAKGLDPEAVAAQVVHALAQPPGVDLLEIAVVSTEQ